MMNLSNLSYTYGHQFSRYGYDISYNDNIFNPYAKDVLYINSGIVGIYHKLAQFSASTPTYYFANIQRCVRVDGKHDDIHNIGKSTTHLTSFNMLGVFAINGSLEKVLTDIYTFLSGLLGKKNLYFTVHSKDLRTKDLLKTVVGDGTIVDLDDNFWEIDDNYGYCGYCTEVFYKAGNKDVEIWNTVIIDSFNNNGVKSPLDFSFIDTGGGLERIYQCLEDNDSVFEDSRFDQFFAMLELSTAAARILLDHLMTVNNIVGSNIFVANTGRGYVLKKFIRRMLVLMDINKISIDNLLVAGSYLITRHQDIKFILEREHMLMSKAEARFNKYCKTKTQLLTEDIFYLYATEGISMAHLIDLAKKNSLLMDSKDIAAAEKQISNQVVAKTIASVAIKLPNNLCTEDHISTTTQNFQVFNSQFEAVKVMKPSSEHFFVYTPDNIVLDVADQCTITIKGIACRLERIVFNHDRVFYCVSVTELIDLQAGKLAIDVDPSSRDMLLKKEYAAYIALFYVKLLTNHAYLISAIYSGQGVHLKIYSPYNISIADKSVKDGLAHYISQLTFVGITSNVDLLEYEDAERIYCNNYSLTSTLAEFMSANNAPHSFISKLPRVIPTDCISIESISRSGYEISVHLLVR